MKTLTTHPQLENLLPPLSESEWQGLENDLLQHGCLSRIVTWNNTIVDGHYRYAICKKYGLPFETVEMTFQSLDEAMFWAWQNQEGRRNMTPYQRAELALKFKPEIAAKALQNMRIGGGDRKSEDANSMSRVPVTPCNTNDEIAKIAGVSRDTVARTEYLIKHADDETKQRLRNGETSINREYTQLKKAAKPMLPQPVPVAKREPISSNNTQELVKSITERYGVKLMEQLVIALLEHMQEVKSPSSFKAFVKKLLAKYCS